MRICDDCGKWVDAAADRPCPNCGPTPPAAPGGGPDPAAMHFGGPPSERRSTEWAAGQVSQEGAILGAIGFGILIFLLKVALAAATRH